jgi:D-arabinose 1-dehydrogenase-like Zn-dependent alcohol dehydrogenase
MTGYRAAVLVAHGHPLELREFPELEPDDGSVVVQVDRAGVCGTDVHLFDGRLAVPLPLVLGHEAVGRVSALGPGALTDVLGQPLAVGDRVTWASSIPCRSCYYCVVEQELSLCERRQVYGINQGINDAPWGSGSYAAKMQLRAGTTIIRVPDGIDNDAVIALGCAGPTVMHALSDAVRPRPGERVIVQGCGPVGLAAAMYAKLAGAGQVMLIGAPASRLELAREIGACDTVLDIEAVTAPGERVRAARDTTFGRRGADLVIEATGQPSAVDEGFQMCRRNGRYLVVGQYTDHGATPLNPHMITKGQLRVFGSWAFSGQDYVRYVDSLPQLTARFDVARLVTTYDLEQANDALADMRAAKVVKPVVAPGGIG